MPKLQLKLKASQPAAAAQPDSVKNKRVGFALMRQCVTGLQLVAAPLPPASGRSSSSSA